jgi:phosphoserine aminotransferase
MQGTKNMGPAGATLVILKKDIVGKHGKTLATMLDYKTHLDNDSLYNTPPVFGILMIMYTLEWLKSIGGVPGMEKINKQKYDLFYGEVDSNPMFVGTAAPEDRSPMNACFLLKDNSLDEEFLNAAKAAGLSASRDIVLLEVSVQACTMHCRLKAYRRW